MTFDDSFLMLVAVSGAAIAAVTIALFQWQLRRSHPDLWSSYDRVFWSWPGDSRSEALQSQVYSKISDRPTRLFLFAQRIGFVIFVLLTVGAGFLFVMSLVGL